MKAVTLLCAIVFTVSACLGMYNLSQSIGRFHLLPLQYLNQVTWAFGQCSLAAFFFILYSRQK